MKIDEVVALSKAGFTAEQIGQMSQAQSQEPKQKPEITPETQPKQTPKVKAPPEPETKTTPETPNPIDALMQQVANLTKTVQANAINNTQLPQGESAEDILASIINPPDKNK